MAIDHLADALNTLKTHEMVGQRVCEVKASKLLAEVFRVLKEKGYLSSYEMVEDGRGGYFKVMLDGRINNCGVIKPRFPVKRHEWPLVEQRYIPGIGIGLLIVSTPIGIMTNAEAEKNRTGGRLLAYIY